MEVIITSVITTVMATMEAVTTAMVTWGVVIMVVVTAEGAEGQMKSLQKIPGDTR